ncbi:threonine--tRNA [Ecytonucleospora hepatopenaei]|uniref:Probable threonine--tRNA ligase, cytoplasmic n=1 Tax=Ecytonucleospora hepatopenaei TaxID=646526 RepID=A0A1W0E522_9MICR|nr:threonine--tRNA [Ecytonucleospora hepatopenaei]
MPNETNTIKLNIRFKENNHLLEVKKNILIFEVINEHFKKENILAAKVNNCEADLHSTLNNEDFLELFTFESKYGKHVFWHSSAHVLGNALVNLYNCKLVNGPPIDEGFYYDIETDKTLGNEDFKKIEKEMIKIINKNSKFVKKTLKIDDLKEMYKENSCKLHFLNQIQKECLNNKLKDENFDDKISVYYNDEFFDMCRGPHVLSTKIIKSVKITKSSSCYFLNDSKNKSLQRIYGVSFPSKEEMKEYEERIKRSKEMDHRKIGRELDLYFFNDYSPGSCFWLPDGTIIYNRLMEFLKKEYIKRGFNEVITPNMFHINLWKESGHYENYKENIYAIEGEDFALKPMNCPGHCVMFRNTERSYKELPLRFADFGVLHRNECSGSLTGLTRVRRFQQDDAHIFCSMSQIKSEISGALNFLKSVYSKFDFKYTLFLSTRPEKFLGQLEEWNVAEERLREAILESNHTYVLNEGDGAFYGPKIDIVLYDAFNRKTQCATIQLDFQLPQRFKLRFKNELGEFETPVMIHRAILGSVERFIAILIESYGKNLPFWLHPRQIGICLVATTETVTNYVDKLCLDINQAFESSCNDVKIRIYDDCKDTFNKKVRKAATDGNKIVLIVGEKEAENNEVNVKKNDRSFNISKDILIKKIKTAIETKEEVKFD